MSTHTAVEPIPARRMGRYARTPDFQQRATLLLLGPNLPGAACKGLGNLWDTDVDGESHDERTARINTAIRICRTCPMLAQFLQQRLTNPMLGEGVWGGQLFGKPTQRLCACGCGKPLPHDAHTQRRYATKTCRMRVYLAQPDKKAADLQRRAIRDKTRRAHRKAAAA